MPSPVVLPSAHRLPRILRSCPCHSMMMSRHWLRLAAEAFALGAWFGRGARPRRGLAVRAGHGVDARGLGAYKDSDAGGSEAGVARQVSSPPQVPSPLPRRARGTRRQRRSRRGVAGGGTRAAVCRDESARSHVLEAKKVQRAASAAAAAAGDLAASQLGGDGEQRRIHGCGIHGPAVGSDGCRRPGSGEGLVRGDGLLGRGRPVPPPLRRLPLSREFPRRVGPFLAE